MYTYPTSIQHAATQLDHIDKNWFRRIELDDLSMYSCQRCILGQVFGHYRNAMAKIFDKKPNPNDLTMPEETDLVYGCFADVHLWKQEILKRRTFDYVSS